MKPTPSQIGPESADQPLADLSRQHLPPSPGSAAYDAASCPGVVRRHKRQLAAQEKRLKRASAENARRLFRDDLVARLWHAAAAGDSRVDPRVREHFGRCVQACLANEAVSSYLANGLTGWSEATLRTNPIIRVEFGHAFVLGRLGESLSAARSKTWGEFLSIQPLDPRDPIYPLRVVYAFKETAPYQKRFEQRGRLRRMLGKQYAPLVLRALRSTKGEFTRGLTEDEAARIRARTGLGPGRFWRAAKGREFLNWPEPPRQLTLFDID
jgi:hypothetical protein